MMTQVYQCDQLAQMNRAQLMNFINIVSFEVNDTVLFLDTHPSSEDALQNFRYFSELRDKALSLYEEKFAPLTIDSANPDRYWNWVKEPWPWEGGNC